MDRAFDYGSKGWGFESLRGRIFSKNKDIIIKFSFSFVKNLAQFLNLLLQHELNYYMQLVLIIKIYKVISHLINDLL